MKLQLLFLLAIICSTIHAQITPAEAGFIDAVADYGADNTGNSITTSQLQNAIDGAISQNKPLFIPAGTYLTDNTLVVENDTQERGAQNVFITGSGVNPEQRTVILLKAGTF
ncbi:MAG: glycosyl hydrolase family 28-related protein, partial [Prolixibacteraceae bacterium]